jgi:hypothetical protein
VRQPNQSSSSSSCCICDTKPKISVASGVTLVISHLERQKINLECYKHVANGPRLEMPLSDELLSQMFVGGPLIGAVTNGKLGNGVEYIVVGWTDVNVQLLDGCEMLDVKHAALKQRRLAYAITYASSQGKTYHVETRLHDTTHYNFSRRTLYTSLGRVSSSELLQVI